VAVHPSRMRVFKTSGFAGRRRAMERRLRQGGKRATADRTAQVTTAAGCRNVQAHGSESGLRPPARPIVDLESATPGQNEHPGPFSSRR
jgi:hypothetical protein